MNNWLYKSIHIYIIAILTILVMGCSKDDNKELCDDQFVDFAHIATESQLHNIDISDIQSSIARFQPSFNAMLSILGLDILSTTAVTDWLTSSVVKAFASDIDSISPSRESIAHIIAHIDASAHKEGIKLPVNCYATAIWGKPQSILFANSTMFIALNHYLGSEHPAYNGLPEYRRSLKDQSQIPYDIAESLVATAYPFVPTDSTSVINRLVYDGAIVAAKMLLVKDAKLKDALGYNESQMKWLTDHESDIWRKMVGSKMIFDHSETTGDRLLQPSPVSSLVSSDCPGRVGRFIGYRIVEAYLKSNKETNITDLLNPSFYGRPNPLSGTNYNPL